MGMPSISRDSSGKSALNTGNLLATGSEVHLASLRSARRSWLDQAELARAFGQERGLAARAHAGADQFGDRLGREDAVASDHAQDPALAVAHQLPALEVGL